MKVLERLALVTNAEPELRPFPRGSHLPGRLSHRRGGFSCPLLPPSQGNPVSPPGQQGNVRVRVRVCIRGCFLRYSHYWEARRCGGRPGGTLFGTKGPQCLQVRLFGGLFSPEHASPPSAWQCPGLGHPSIAALASWWAWGPREARGTLNSWFALWPHGPPLAW